MFAVTLAKQLRERCSFGCLDVELFITFIVVTIELFVISITENFRCVYTTRSHTKCNSIIFRMINNENALELLNTSLNIHNIFPHKLTPVNKSRISYNLKIRVDHVAISGISWLIHPK